MKKTIIGLLFFMGLLAISAGSFAKTTSRPYYPNIWEVTGEFGMVGLWMEMDGITSRLAPEFNDNPGYSFGVSLSRTVGLHWKPNFSMLFYHFTGDNNYPVFSAEGNQPDFNDLARKPVEYKTDMGAFLLGIRYYPLEFTRPHYKWWRIDPYLEVQLGLNVLSTELRYKTLPEGKTTTLIFEKGKGDPARPAAIIGQYSCGGGTELSFNHDWKLLLSFNLDFVNYDCLDAVHNYTPSGDKISVMTVVPRLMVGITIPIAKKRPAYRMWAPR